MGQLTTTPNIDRPDEIYARILQVHEGLDLQQSTLVNAKLILLLANHIGDEDVIAEAIELARPAAG